MRLHHKGYVQRKTPVCDEVCPAPLWGGMRWQALQSGLVSTDLIGGGGVSQAADLRCSSTQRLHVLEKTLCPAR